MRLSIRTRIFLGIFIVVGLFVLSVNYAASYFLNNEADRQMRERIESAWTSYNNFDYQLTELLKSRAELISQASYIKATLSIPNVDADTILQSTSYLEPSPLTDLFLVLDLSGNLIADVISPQTKENTMGNQGLNDALNGLLTYAQWRYNGSFFNVALAPVVSGRELVGVIVIGQQINLQKRIKAQGEAINSEFSFLSYEESNSGNSIERVLSRELISKTGHSTSNLPNERLTVNNYLIGQNRYYFIGKKVGVDIGTIVIFQSDQKVLEGLAPLKLLIIGTSFITIIFAGIVSWRVAAGLTKPINRLISAAHEFGAGNLNMRVNQFSNDEIGDLAVAFNSMALDLQEGRKSLLDKKVAEEKMRGLAYFDSLTGLGNRRFFREKLNKHFTQNLTHSKILALLFIDLDGFKRVNDSLGHSAGDSLLAEVGQRLLSSVREDDLIAFDEGGLLISRLGGDEFTVILSELESEKSAALIAERIINLLAKPYRLLANDVVVTASIGIAIASNGEGDGEDLLWQADMAMYAAKSQGKNTYCYYQPKMANSGINRMENETEFRQALANQEIIPAYQPVVDARNGEIFGVEALARWIHPNKGFISPADFIPLAEDMGCIIELGLQIIRHACNQFKSWQSDGIKLNFVSVNVSALHFRTNDFYHSIVSIIEDTGMDPTNLILELTESSLMEKVDEATEKMNLLKAYGIQMAIDDFGTGYSSLAYLSRFPVDILKIDREFIAEISDKSEKSILVDVIIAMAAKLSLKVVAEGIETQQQVDYLADRQVRFLQGFYFSKAEFPDVLTPKLLNSNQSLKSID